MPRHTLGLRLALLATNNAHMHPFTNATHLRTRAVARPRAAPALRQERALGQTFEVDVELACCLRAPGISDDLGDTIDYSAVYAAARRVVQEGAPRNLLEAVAGDLAREVLALSPRAHEVVVRVRKPAVALGGPLAHSGVEIRRARGDV